jgi:hypothetical protein
MILAWVVAVERYRKARVRKICPATVGSGAAVFLSMPIQVAAHAPFPFPMLNCTDVSIGRQDGDELPLNFVLGTEFKTLHTSNYLSVELVGTEGFPVEHVDVRSPTEPTIHPRMVHHFG